MMQALFGKLKDPLTDSWMDILHIIEKNPELEMINADSHAKNVKVIDSRS